MKLFSEVVQKSYPFVHMSVEHPLANVLEVTEFFGKFLTGVRGFWSHSDEL
jgi:hypothetical protein